MRTEKQQFVKNFPRAIELVINTALRTKLNNIDKNNKKYINGLVENSNRVCMIPHCNGKLNKLFECIKCATRFCEHCERIMNANHVCNSEDVASVSVVSEYVKCPECGVSIEKASGCNHMTCASCRTNFNFDTLTKSNAGSNNIIIAPQKTKMKFDFKQKYHAAISRRLFIIESNEPSSPSTEYLNKVVYNYITKKELDENKVVESFEKYIMSKIKYSNFISTITEVMEMHHKDTMSIFALDRIIESNGWSGVKVGELVGELVGDSDIVNLDQTKLVGELVDGQER
jgi:hypothetical protein